jgi:RNA polymerase sigma factor (sigma-70 family)
VAASEDLAQETFIVAWRQLRELREPSQLRRWLCGIVRNLAANLKRRDLRRGGSPSPVDVLIEQAAPEADPASQAVSQEEEALLWRALATLPEKYREPMVLFYREQHSVAQVSMGLELSEEVVRQRLSRGRALLREEVSRLVESTLVRTRPGAKFTAGVLAALPLLPANPADAAGATLAVVAKSMAGTVKGFLGNFISGPFLGPLIGLNISWLGLKAASSTARSPQERSCIKRYAIQITIFCFVMSIALAATLSEAGKLYMATAARLIIGVGIWVILLVATILVWTRRMEREIARIRIETGTDSETCDKSITASELRP